MTTPDPSAITANPAELAIKRRELIFRAQQYFASQNILQVDTPQLALAGVTDPQIENLRTQSNGQTLYLQTSPEYAMKKLLAAGYPDIGQICHVFRDGESGKKHLCEFTMAEWYRHKFSLQQIITDTIDFICAAAPRLANASVCQLHYQDAFEQSTGLHPLNSKAEDFANYLNADDYLRNTLKDDINAWRDLVLGNKIIPDFAKDQFTVLHHYPADQAALAQLSPDDERWADRFEVFFGGMELANGFVELTDPKQQRERFENDQRLRQQQGKFVPAIDEQLLMALESGLPPCAGVAVGLDRVMMLEFKASHIHQVQLLLPNQ